MNVIHFKDKSFNVESVCFVRLFFCYYFDFNGNRFLRLAAKVYCISCGTLLICSGIYFFEINYKGFVLPLAFVAFDFCVNVVVSCFTAENYFFKFCHGIKAIDSAMGIDKRTAKETQSFINFLIIWILSMNVLFTGSYCYFSPACQATPGTAVITIFLLAAEDISHVVRLIILFLILSRMHLLSRKIEQYSFRSSVISETRKNWDYYLNIYWQLMDCFGPVELLMKNLILINLVTTFSKLLGWIYNTIILFNSGFNNATGVLIVTCIENIHAVLLSSLPGVMVAMIQSRVDRIKSSLAKHLYLYTGTTEVADIKRFLELIELRPFEMRILRLIPVDMNLPAGLLSLCITYLIALAQFLPK